METSRGWEGPRRVTLERSGQGFGFTLRQFIVYPPEAAIAEHDRMEEEHTKQDASYVKKELEPMDTIFVKQVREGSPADRAGLNAGDRIVSVDGENISGKKYQAVVDTIQSRDSSVVLEVVPKSDDILQVAYPSSSLRSPRATSPPSHAQDSVRNNLSVPETSPTSESGFLSDDDILIVGGSPNKTSKGGNLERTEIVLPVKSEANVPKFVVSVPNRTGEVTHGAMDPVVVPKDGTIEIQGIKKADTSPKKESYLHGNMQSVTMQPSETKQSKNDTNVEQRQSKSVYPQRTFRLTGVLSSPVSKGYQGRSVQGTELEGNTVESRETIMSSPVAKYRPCANILPNKPVLVKVDSSTVCDERGDTRTSGIPIRMTVTPQGQQSWSSHSRPSSERVPSMNAHVINVSNSNDGQVRIRVKDPFYQESPSSLYSNSTSAAAATAADRTSPSMILDASQPVVKLSKSPVNFLPDDVADTPHINTNRKYSDPSSAYRTDVKLKPFHYLEKPQSPPHQTDESSKSKSDDTDGKLKKFLFQTTATIDVKDHAKYGVSSKEGPPIPARTSSRGRVRERSLDRDRKKEKAMIERKQRSRSYDRNYHKRNARNQSFQQHTIYAVRSQESQLLKPPRARTRSRKDSEPTSPGLSPNQDTQSGEKVTVSKSYITRRTSYLKATHTDEGKEVDIGSVSSHSSTLEEAENQAYLSEEKRPATVAGSQGISLQKPRDLSFETETKQSSTKEIFEAGEVIKEGPLSVKMDIKDGKRFTDRSWKSVWAKLISGTLYLYRENRDSAGNTSDVEEHPVNIDQAMVDIAYDYIKKKNVFRLCTVDGDDYLFNAHDKDTMLAWIHCIQACRDSVGENKLVINEDLLLRRAYIQDPNKQAPAPPRTPSPGDSQKKPTSRRQDSKDTPPIKSRGSKKSRKKPLPPTQEETVSDSKTYGIPLDQCPPSPSHEFVPLFIVKCCSIVEKYGLDVVGVYRVPGNTGGITYLKEELKKDIREVDFTDDRWRDVNVVSSLLKLFFRKLPNPLIPTEQYSAFIHANRTPNPPDRMANLRRQIHNLPEHHFATLKFLAKHLKVISSNSKVNKMEVRNLAIVFGPTLIRTADDNMVTMVQDMSDQCKIVESVIEYCDWFFCEDVESQQDVPHNALPGADVMTDANVLLAKAREEKKQYDTISPKDIMVSVLSAANRKLKRPDRRSFEASKDLDEKDGPTLLTPNSKQGQNSQSSSRTESQSTEADSSVSCSDGHTPSSVTSDKFDLKDSEIKADSAFLFPEEYTFGSVRGRNLGDSSPNARKTFNEFPKDRHKKGDGTVNWIMRDDPPSLHQEWKKTEYSKERERVEREHKLALQDYEKEDSTNLEEIIQSKERMKDICASKGKGVVVDSSIQDTSSVTSDYSTTSSNNNNCFTDNSTRTDGDRKGSRSLTPDSNVSQGSSEDSEFFRSITAAFEAKYQSLFNKDIDEDSTLVGDGSESSLSSTKVTGTDERPDNIPRSKSFTSGALLSQEKKSDDLSRPTSLTLAERSDSLKVATVSQPHLVSPRSPQKKTKIEVTLVFEKSEVTPRQEKQTGSHSLQNSPVKKANLSPAARKEHNRAQRRRRHTLGGTTDARGPQKIVEITLVGEHTTERKENETPVRKLKSSQSFTKADMKSSRDRRRNCHSNPSLMDGTLESGKSLTLPPKKKQDGPMTDKECHPQKLNSRQEFFEIQASL